MKTQIHKMRAARLIAALFVCAPLLASCGANLLNFTGMSSGSNSSHINNKTKFSESSFGVAASPRMTSSSKVPKGGGRYQIGKPYKVAGRWYTPKDNPNYSATGKASWYGPNFHGRQTANGEIFDQYALSAAHPTLPLPSYVRVTNLANRKSIIVRVNDRGPFAHGRVIDLSKRTAEILDFHNQGIAKVKVEYVGRAPLQGDDTRILMASLNAKSPLENGNRGTQFAVADKVAPQLNQSKNNSNRISLAEIKIPTPVSGFSRTNLSEIQANVLPIVNHASTLLTFASRVKQAGDAGLFYAPPTQTMSLPKGKTFGAAANAAQTLAKNQHIDEAFHARRIDVNLGMFSDAETINEISHAFALIGAVEKVSLPANQRDVTLLRLSHLKPGVTNTDVLNMAKDMGLSVDLKVLTE